MDTKLLEIKKSIIKECVSYEELSYLQDHKQQVLNTGDAELCQWAGITEEEYNAGKLNPDLSYEEDFISLDLHQDEEYNPLCTIAIDGQELTLTQFELIGLKNILTNNFQEIQEYFKECNRKNDEFYNRI
jgi:hypothetical protein